MKASYHPLVVCFLAAVLPVDQAGAQVGANPGNAMAGVRWPAPVLTDTNLDQWARFIDPTPKELSWRKIRWHTSLATAAEEARRLQRPILLWTMNGNPCGET